MVNITQLFISLLFPSPLNFEEEVIMHMAYNITVLKGYGTTVSHV